MTDITVTAAQVAALDPLKAVIRSYIAAVAITKGQAVYFTTAGKVGVADANDSGKEQFRGIALNTVAAGDAVDVLHEGEVGGFSVSALNGDALVYLSNTAGKLATAAGTMEVHAGRVVVLTDGPTLTKVVRVFTQWEANWS
jgi:hypothetical protein